MNFHYFSMTIRSIRQNNFQAFLAILGVTVGVAALIVSLGLARGARESISEQMLAIGANMIVVTAGNYQVKRPQDSGIAPADHGFIELDSSGMSNLASVGSSRASRIPNQLKVGGANIFLAHFEDDPNAEHDHPTAAERLGDAMAGLGAAATLSIEDARAIENSLEGVSFVASGVHENARVELAQADGGKSWFTRLHGTEPTLPDLRAGWAYSSGRFFSESEFDDKSSVMVLGQVVSDRLFGANLDPVGKTVYLWNQPFEIVGVVSSKTWASRPAAGDDQFDAIYVPVSTIHELLNLSKLNTITAAARSAGETSRLAGDITSLLRQRHGISEQMPDDFTVQTQAEKLLGNGLPPDVARVVAGNMGSVDDITMEQLSGSLERANATMVTLLASVAGVSLIVGGIGVVNLLLLSVTQRTKEVGLRLSVGAKRRDIVLQFMSEATALTLIGGVIGILVGFSLVNIVGEILGWSVYLSTYSMIVAMVISAILGVISGLYPAYKAASLDPVGALFYE
ncbi:ABC transporter permease [Gammaproteobacteria bacterium]|nr:ABC transporter permease [Gammaproteobacteria bacterium]